MKNLAIKKWILRLPAIFIMAVSWYLSSQEKVSMPDFENSDKFVHFICFGGLAAAWTLWFSPKLWKKSPVKFLLIVVAIVSFYGIVDEIHQSFVPGRSCSVFDWISDTFGAILGCFARILINPLTKFLEFEEN